MLVPLFPRRCDACTWGVIVLGKCMVGPPRVHPTGVWPDVEPDARCREYFPKHTPEGAPICRTCLYYQADGPGQDFYCLFLPPGYSVSKMPRVHDTRRCHEWRPNYTLMVEE